MVDMILNAREANPSPNSGDVVPPCLLSSTCEMLLTLENLDCVSRLYNNISEQLNDMTNLFR